METKKGFLRGTEPGQGQETGAARRKRIRARHRALRDAMTAEEAAKKSRAVCGRITASGLYRDAEIIYAYYPLGGEADCRAVIRRGLADKKTVALPRVGRDLQMEFYRITSLDEVAEGSFHVMEPTAECPIHRGKEGLVLVPGLVFDRTGNRYGYGKGYYDRYLARFPGLTRIAPAYEHQLEETLFTLPTDVRMDAVVTEENWYPGQDRTAGKVRRRD